MDIKKLYDDARDGGIDFRKYTDSDIADCVDIWTLSVSGSPEYVADFMSEVVSTDSVLGSFCRKIPSALISQRALGVRCDNFTLVALSAAHLTSTCADIGRAITGAIEKESREVVMENLHDWFYDCVSYQVDMDQAHEEDRSRAFWGGRS
jgi:hypothetical protein